MVVTLVVLVVVHGHGPQRLANNLKDSLSVNFKRSLASGSCLTVVIKNVIQGAALGAKSLFPAAFEFRQISEGGAYFPFSINGVSTL